MFLALFFKGVGQIEVKKNEIKSVLIGEVKRNKLFACDLNYLLRDGKDSAFSVSFQNEEYSSITDIKSAWMIGGKKEVESLYDMLKSCFKPENANNKDYSLYFKMGKKDCSISPYVYRKAVYAWFSVDGGYIKLTEKEVDKLFSK